MDGTTKLGEQVVAIAASTPWRVAGTGDFNRDGKADIVWQNVSAGTMYVWFMASTGGVASFASGAQDIGYTASCFVARATSSTETFESIYRSRE